jgi:hypothetical protein
MTTKSSSNNKHFVKPKAAVKARALRIDELCPLLPISFGKEILWTFDYLLDQSQYYNRLSQEQRFLLQVRAFETLAEIVDLYNNHLSKNGIQYGLREKSKQELNQERKAAEFRAAVKRLRKKAAKKREG